MLDSIQKVIWNCSIQKVIDYCLCVLYDFTGHVITLTNNETDSVSYYIVIWLSSIYYVYIFICLCIIDHVDLTNAQQWNCFVKLLKVFFPKAMLCIIFQDSE